MTAREAYVLDTHAAIWLQLDPARLGARARKVLARAAPTDLYISDVTLSETARLLWQRRVETAVKPVDWLGRFALGFTVLPVNAPIALAAAAFTWEHRDPCDRHILASAMALSLPLVTLDPKIAEFAPRVGVQVIW
jgi:PIN domain nuclease of toxin-antitoxin system